MIFILIFISIFSLLFPVIIGLLTPFERTNEEPEKIAPEISVVYTSPDARGTEDGTVEVAVFINGKNVITDMHSYLVSVLAAEMPVSFEPEALRAQAVAARTFTVYKMKNGRTEAHPDSDVCTDTGCCQAYCNTSGMRAKWGTGFEENLRKIEDAVKATDGDCAVYSGEPILAAFHSSSCGKTEACVNVWGSDVPYLISVESPEDDESVPNYTSRVSVSYDEFKAVVEEKYPDALLEGDGSGWVTDGKRDESGRLEYAVIGGIEIPGTALRRMFSLRSAAIDIGYDEYGFNFTTTGYGHGVGMSQYGANSLAKKGFGYEDIIAWYYPGTELAGIKSLLK